MTISFFDVIASPLTQIGLVFVLLAIALFITAIIQKRLTKLVAWWMAGTMIAGILLGAVGTFTAQGVKTIASGNTNQPKTEIALQAEALYLAGDTVSAYRLAEDALVFVDDPDLSLLCARSALASGDLSAAANYYGELENLQAETDDVSLSNELNNWNEIVSKKKTEMLQEAVDEGRQLQQQLRTNAPDDIQKRLTNVEQLISTEYQLEQYQENPDASDLNIDQIKALLIDIFSKEGGEEALDTLQEIYIQAGDFEGLINTLEDCGEEGLVRLAELFADDTIPFDTIAKQYPGETEESFRKQIISQLLSGIYSAENRQSLMLAASTLLAEGTEAEYNQAVSLINEAANMPAQIDTVRALKSYDRIRELKSWMQTAGDGQEDNVINELYNIGSKDDFAHRTQKPSTSPSQSPSSTPAPSPTMIIPDELNGQNVRDDLIPLINICAPEMTETGKMRFYTTVAEGSSGYPGGEPGMDDFEFRTNVGFGRQLDVLSMEQAIPERYTMLLIDKRPIMTAEAIALAKQAALEYVRSMPEGENVLIYSGGIPSNYQNVTYPSGKVELFGNMEMETYLFSSDKNALEQFIMADYGGDAFDGADVYQMISWALNQMTAIGMQGVSGEWESFPLTAATSRFGQVIVFTSGDPDHKMQAGAEGKSIDYVRGAAIAANAAVHIVAINPVNTAVDLAELAQAGRGSLIDPSTDSLGAFYQFVRNRQVKVLLTECDFPEYPVDDFFDLLAKHLPTGVIVGFRRNPGKGIDLVGTLHYSDMELSDSDFSDLTGDDTNGDNTGIDNTGGDNNQNGSDDETIDIEDYTGNMDNLTGTLQVFGTNKRSIPRASGASVIVTILGSGFSDYTTSQVSISLNDDYEVNNIWIDVTSDTAIRFFLPSNLPAGYYTLNINIGGNDFVLPDQLFIYEAGGAVSISFGPWVINSSSGERDGSGWLLTNAVLNGYLDFNGQLRVSGNWLNPATTELTLTPDDSGEKVVFDPESDDFFVQQFFTDRSKDLNFAAWHPFSLPRYEDHAAVTSRPLAGQVIQSLDFGLFNLGWDTATIFTDRIEIPVFDLNLDIPLQEYLLMSQGVIPFEFSSTAKITADKDSFDFAMEASAKTGSTLKLFGALSINECKVNIDTSVPSFKVKLVAKLLEQEISAEIGFKGYKLDLIGIGFKVDIPVTKTPIDVTITQLGGKADNLAQSFSGRASDLLGIRLTGTAKFECGSVGQLMPFLKDIAWLKGKIPPILATDEASLSLQVSPFSLSFSTNIKLFDEFMMGRAEIDIGHYRFTETLLNISDSSALGFHALLSLCPDLDFKVARVHYNVTPSIDINNHGAFVKMNGGSGFGINLGPITFEMDFTGTVMMAFHKPSGLTYPELALIVNAKPLAGIPGFWNTGQTKDVRLLINENGVHLIGFTSILSETMDWLKGKVTDAASVSWNAVRAGMSDLGETLSHVWNVTSSSFSGLAEDVDGYLDSLLNILPDEDDVEEFVGGIVDIIF